MVDLSLTVEDLCAGIGSGISTKQVGSTQAFEQEGRAQLHSQQQKRIPCQGECTPCSRNLQSNLGLLQHLHKKLRGVYPLLAMVTFPDAFTDTRGRVECTADGSGLGCTPPCLSDNASSFFMSDNVFVVQSQRLPHAAVFSAASFRS